jgi:hypothetical protein
MQWVQFKSCGRYIVLKRHIKRNFIYNSVMPTAHYNRVQSFVTVKHYLAVTAARFFADMFLRRHKETLELHCG